MLFPCSQLAIARVLRALNKRSEAHAMLQDLFKTALSALGPTTATVRDILQCYWQLVRELQGEGEAEDLRSRAEALGCDVSVCV